MSTLGLRRLFTPVNNVGMELIKIKSTFESNYNFKLTDMYKYIYSLSVKFFLNVIMTKKN